MNKPLETLPEPLIRHGIGERFLLRVKVDNASPESAIASVERVQRHSDFEGIVRQEMIVSQQFGSPDVVTQEQLQS